MNTYISRTLSALAITGTLGAGAMAGMAIGHAGPFDQRDFPCQEDEVLGYAPQFGPDYVGCIHVDTLAGTRLDKIESAGGEPW